MARFVARQQFISQALGIVAIGSKTVRNFLVGFYSLGQDSTQSPSVF